MKIVDLPFSLFCFVFFCQFFYVVYYCYWTEDLALSLAPAGSVWILEFMQERFHIMGPSEFQRTAIKSGDSEKRKGLGQKKQQEGDQLRSQRSPGMCSSVGWASCTKGSLVRGVQEATDLFHSHIDVLSLSLPPSFSLPLSLKSMNYS